MPALSLIPSDLHDPRLADAQLNNTLCFRASPELERVETHTNLPLPLIACTSVLPRVLTDTGKSRVIEAATEPGREQRGKSGLINLSTTSPAIPHHLRSLIKSIDPGVGHQAPCSNGKIRELMARLTSASCPAWDDPYSSSRYPVSYREFRQGPAVYDPFHHTYSDAAYLRLQQPISTDIYPQTRIHTVVG